MSRACLLLCLCLGACAQPAGRNASATIARTSRTVAGADARLNRARQSTGTARDLSGEIDALAARLLSEK